jgi:hypothetical protein
VCVIKNSPHHDISWDTTTAAELQTDTGLFTHNFSAFIDLPVLYTEATIQSFLAMNNKEDTLTQSQML